MFALLLHGSFSQQNHLQSKCNIYKPAVLPYKVRAENTFSEDALLMKLQEFNFIKKKIPAQMLFCEFWEISHKNFFKEPFGRLLLHKHSLCLLSQDELVPFQNRYHTYFPAEYFLGLICRLGTRVSSIFQTLSQKPIFNLVEHL